MKYNEEQFKEEVAKLYNSEIKIVSKFKGLTYPILCQDKYGVMSMKAARQILINRPSIKMALNKTEYFMNQLRDLYPEIAKRLTPASEYIKAKDKMLFNTQYGIVSFTPDNLIHGHIPTIRASINRKEYFKNQLLFLYDNKYDFIIDGTDRHKGRVTLVCPIHGEVSVDSDTIFNGNGCPICNGNNHHKSNLFYLVRLYNEEESFYKLGISHYNAKKEIVRFKTYKKLGYNIEVIYTYLFAEALECKEFETFLKKLIKNNLYSPKNWPAENSNESFTNELLPLIKENLIYDIVSTSSESQSSVSDTDTELTSCVEDNTL